MQSEQLLSGDLSKQEQMGESTTPVTNKLKGERHMNSPEFKNFFKGLEEITLRLRNNPEAQMEVARNLW